MRILNAINVGWLSLTGISFLIIQIFELHPGNGVTEVQIQAFSMYFPVLSNVNKQSRETNYITLFNDVIVTTL